MLKLPDALNQIGDSALKGNLKVMTGMKLLFQLLTLSPRMWFYIHEFRQIIRSLQPTIIHTNGIKANLITALAGFKGIPVIWHIQDFYGARPFMARSLRWASQNTMGAIAISHAVAEDAKTTLPGLPIQVIYSAINIDYFCPDPKTPPSSDLTLRVGLIATFARWKGHDIFLEAAAEIVKTHPDLKVHFCIVGGAIYQTRGFQFSEPELKDKALQLGIVDKVDFLGFHQDIAKIYRSLDIVVHASTQPEPLGLAIVEAMACGKSVIVSQAGGAAELFTHNYDAVGVPPRDPIALAAAILDLLKNSEKRQIISEKARDTAVERFSHQRLGTQILAVYNSMKLN